MSEKKIRVTKSQKFEDIIALLRGENVKHGTTVEIAVEALEHEMSLLARKNAGDSEKMTEAQKENEALKNQIIEFMRGLAEDSAGVKCTDVMNAIPGVTSPQKARGLLRQLIDAGKVINEEVKGKSLFRLA